VTAPVLVAYIETLMHPIGCLHEDANVVGLAASGDCATMLDYWLSSYSGD